MKKTVFAVLSICLILSSSVCNKAEESTNPLSEESVPAVSAREEGAREGSAREEGAREGSAPETAGPSKPEAEAERQTPDPLPIEGAFFSDAVFLKSIKDQADSDHDGFLCKEELEAVTEVDLFMEERLASVSGMSLCVRKQSFGIEG